jgi:protein-tyrosine phosphatase
MTESRLNLPALACAIGLATIFTTSSVNADIAEATLIQQETGVLTDYRRLLPLEGGSNFRDLGGYPTEDGRHVRRGLLFRSGAPSSLTETDQAYLAQFGFESVVDLRSTEELDLYPNQWVKNAGIDYYNHEYSIMAMLSSTSREDLADMSRLYPDLAYGIMPQLTQYFTLLADGRAPIMVNCSAGQDRTGITSALLLTILGVPYNLVVEDYLLSTDFRRPVIERGDIDFAEKAQTNAYAALLSQYSQAETTHATPLVSPDGTPYLEYALRAIEADYGSVEGFMLKGLGLNNEQLDSIRSLYLE